MLVHSVEDQLVDDEFLRLLAANRATYTPTLVVGRNWTRAIASVILKAPAPIDDPNDCVDSNTVAKIANVGPLHDRIPPRRRSTQAVFRMLEGAGATGAIMAENLRRVHAAGATIAVGTDAGNPLTLHGPSIYDEMETMQAAGVPAGDIIVMATRNGARTMRRDRDIGTLEAGKLADLLILGEDPRANMRAFRSVQQVMRGGTLYRQADLAQSAR